MTNVPGIVKAAAIGFAANAVWGGLLFVSGEQLELVVPLALLLFAAPVFAFGLSKVIRKYFVGAIVHTIAVLAIGGATMLFLSSKVIVLLAMAQALGATVVLLQPNVRAPFLRRRTGFRVHKR